MSAPAGAVAPATLAPAPSYPSPLVADIERYLQSRSPSSLAAAIRAVLRIHGRVHPPDGPTRCPDCHGVGTVHVDGRHHHPCACTVPWCAGCGSPCDNADCPTVVEIAAALGLLPEQEHQ